VSPARDVQFSVLAALPQEQLRPPNSPNSFVGPKLFSDSDDALLQELEAASFWYFGSRQSRYRTRQGPMQYRTFDKTIWEASHPPVLD